jgi:putative redox protein
MNIKTIHVDALDPGSGSSVRFVAQNPRHDRINIQAHITPPDANGPGSSPASTGLGPMEALLAALATCTATDVQDIMRKRRTPLASYRLEVEGTRAEGTPGRYTRIVVRHIASGEGVSVEQLRRAAHLSHEKYCSVAASLREDIEFVLEAKLEA